MLAQAVQVVEISAAYRNRMQLLSGTGRLAIRAMQVVNLSIHDHRYENPSMIQMKEEAATYTGN